MSLLTPETPLTVLGRMVCFEPLARIGLERLSKADFSNPRHQKLFDAIARAHSSGRPYVPQEILRYLGDDVTMLGQAMEVAIDAGTYAVQNFEAYCASLRLAGQEVRARQIGVELAESPEPDAASKALEALRQLDARPAQPESFTELVRQEAAKPMILSIPTGIPRLDRLVRLEPCTLTVIAARPGVGKTAFLMGIALDAAAQGYDPLLFSLEMSPDELARRHHRGIPQGAQRLKIQALDNSTVGILCQLARHHVRNHEHALILVDYLQLLRPNRRYEARWEQVGDVVRELKALAMSTRVPVLCAAQLSRAVEQRAGKRPELSDLRESGETEQVADIVLLLHRSEAAAELHVAKNRHGQTGLVPLTFLAEQVRFRERHGY
jgi:replicative DNA helicase